MNKINLNICCGMNCLTHGGQELTDIAETNPLFQKNCNITNVTCMDSCGDTGINSPNVEINGIIYNKMTSDKLIHLITELVENQI